MYIIVSMNIVMVYTIILIERCKCCRQAGNVRGLYLW